MDCPENQYSFYPPSHPVVGRFRAQNHTGGAIVGDTGREGGREGGRDEEGRSKGAGREEGGRMNVE